MTRPDWPSIKRDYVETTLTLAEVGAKWGVRRGTLSARATRENWNDQKQQFAANLEQARRKKIIAQRSEEQAKFHSNTFKLANAQLGMIARLMQEKDVDVPKLLKLTNALANVQRVGSSAFDDIGTGRPGAAPDAAAGDRADDPNGIGGGEVTARVSVHCAPPVMPDVLNALTALGYSDKEAAAAVKQLPEGLAVSDAIRQALNVLAKAYPARVLSCAGRP
jgi:hypothetical protein